jgi:hypothetical protein
MAYAETYLTFPARGQVVLEVYGDPQRGGYYINLGATAEPGKTRNWDPQYLGSDGDSVLKMLKEGLADLIAQFEKSLASNAIAQRTCKPKSSGPALD